MIEAILKIAGPLLKIISEWHERKVEASQKKWAEFRNSYEKKKDDRARRASLADANAVLRKEGKHK